MSTTNNPAIYHDRLDHLRFYAATLVMLHHFKGNITNNSHIWWEDLSSFASYWLTGGGTGVSLFLVLSGFLFCTISRAGEYNIDYRGFIKNRILRIFPLVTFIFLIILCASRQESGPIDILRLITLQMNTGHPYTGAWHQYLPIGPIWTIAVEFQFYLIFPLIMIFFKRLGFLWLTSLILLTILIKLILIILTGTEIYFNIYHTLIGRLDQFLIGIALGALYIKHRLEWISHLPISIAMLLASLISLTELITYDHNSIVFTTLSLTIESVLWSGVLISYLMLPIKIPVKINQLLSYLGRLSFSIYLTHLFVGEAVTRYFSLPTQSTPYHSIIQNIKFILPPVLAISFLTYNIIEKPFFIFKAKYNTSL